jgi:CDP-6-deoxy-D-xylo-4-hexulose-3-dehydrase
MYKYPLATSTWNHKEFEQMNNVISSKNFTMGKNVAELEKKFAEYFGANYSVMVNSGSSANLLMFNSLLFSSNHKYRLNPGDEVIVPAVSWSTSYFPIFQSGLKMKFVDIDLNTLNYDLKSLKESITTNTRAILVVNLLGNPNDFNEINKIINNRNILILEDNCESMGARYKGKYTGTFGLMGTFSSFFSHHISTMEGGFITTDDEEIYNILLALRSHGWTRHLPKSNKLCEINNNDFYNTFRFILPGYNLRPLELSGAIGLAQMSKLDDIIRVRNANGKYFTDILKNNLKVYIQEEVDYSSWFGFSMILKENLKNSRSDFVQILNRNGFEVRPIVAGNFTRSESIKYLNHEIFSDLKNANYLHDNGLFIGNHHYDMKKPINLLSQILNEIE